MFSHWRAQRLAASNLMRYWDALVTGEGSHPSRVNLDTSIQATVRHVHASYDASPADPAFANRLLEDLMQSAQLQSLRQSTLVANAPTASSNHRNTAGEVAMTRRSGRPLKLRLFPAISAVGLLLAAMLGGILFWPESGPSEPPAIPAAIVPSELPEIESNTLVDISFPAGALGADEESLLILGEVTVAPGDTVSRYSPCVQDWLYLLHVETGTMTTDLEEEAHILRRGQSVWETVPAGAAATLDAGDTLYYRFFSDEFTGIGNRGAQELRLLWFMMGGMTPPCNSDASLSGATDLWSQYTLTAHIDPAQPARLIIRVLSAPPGVTFPQEGPGALATVAGEQRALGGKQWIAVRAGTLEYGRVPANHLSATPVRTIGADAGLILTEGTLFAAGADQPVVMMSAGDQPVDLAVMNISVGELDADGGIPAP